MQQKQINVQNRDVEKNFYGEQKREEDMLKKLKDVKLEVDQLSKRKQDLIIETDKLSQNLKFTIERTNNLK